MTRRISTTSAVRAAARAGRNAADAALLGGNVATVLGARLGTRLHDRDEWGRMVPEKLVAFSAAGGAAQVAAVRITGIWGRYWAEEMMAATRASTTFLGAGLQGGPAAQAAYLAGMWQRSVAHMVATTAAVQAAQAAVLSPVARKAAANARRLNRR